MTFVGSAGGTSGLALSDLAVEVGAGVGVEALSGDAGGVADLLIRRLLP